MAWNKNTSKESAATYKELLERDVIGQYTDHSEQYPVVTSMRLNKNSVLLDAGCGTGRFLANTVSDQLFVGLDVSIEMLRVARDDLKRGLFVVGELEHLPFKEGVFDEVISSRVLQHIKNQGQAIKEFSRVCKKNGDVIVLSLNTWTLHCLYKNMRIYKLSKIINYPFKLLLGKRSVISKWAFEYDNYCSLPELCRLFENARLDVVEKKGAQIGQVWIFNYLYLGKLLQKVAPGILKLYFNICLYLDKKLSMIFPINYFMDKIIVKGVKNHNLLKDK